LNAGPDERCKHRESSPILAYPDFPNKENLYRNKDGNSGNEMEQRDLLTKIFPHTEDNQDVKSQDKGLQTDKPPDLARRTKHDAKHSRFQKTSCFGTIVEISPLHAISKGAHFYGKL
jgi:hypothetical protein